MNFIQNSRHVCKSIYFSAFKLDKHHSRLYISKLSTKDNSETNKPIYSPEKDIDFSKLNPDKFGDLSEHYKVDKLKRLQKLKSEDLKNDPDGYDQLEIKRGIKKSIEAYGRMMNELYHSKSYDLRELLKLHREFIYENRYIPESPMYTLLIDACAQAGYTKKAIELFHEMKRYKLRPTKATVTALFNACANCTHTKEYGLQQTKLLREMFQLDGYEFNEFQYNSMIKAFAKLGDKTNAFMTLDEMTSKGHDISLDTYAMLLVGCISDKRNGLFDAVGIFTKILQSQQQLNTSTFNLFLRCIRDCHIANDSLLKKLCQNSVRKISNKGLLTEPNQSKTANENEQRISTSNNQSLPNLLNGENLNQVIGVDFSSLTAAKNRFMLFGGPDNFLKLMKSKNVNPDLKTLSLIVRLIDPKECFQTTMRLVDECNLKINVDLYNVMMKQVAIFDPKQRPQIIKSMQDNRIKPDIMTFGAIAFGCKNTKHAKTFLTDIRNFGIVPNNFIIGNLINNACHNQDLQFIDFLLDYTEQNNFRMSNIDFEKIDLLLRNMKQEMTTLSRKNYEVSEQLTNLYQKVSIKFKSQQKKTKIFLNNNVWQQFESENAPNNKQKYNSVVKYMKTKMDIKYNKQKEEIVDYNEEID